MNEKLLNILGEAWQHRAKINRFFLMNAAAKRGLPNPDDSPIDVNVIHTVEPTPAVADSKTTKITDTATTNATTTTADTKSASSTMPTWLKTLVAVGAIGATGGGVAAIANYFKSPTAGIATNNGASGTQDSGSVLQFLEDQGYHVK